MSHRAQAYNPFDHPNIDAPPESLQFDQAWVPPTLVADDAIEPCNLIDAITSQDHSAVDSEAAYENLPIKAIRLSNLKRVHDADRRYNALNILLEKLRVNVDDRFKVLPSAPPLYWEATSHYLDHMLVVPNMAGLQAIVPNADIDPTYAFDLDLTCPHWNFPQPNRTELGFDSTNRMMYIGKCRGENVWFAWVPRTILETYVPPSQIRPSGRFTAMTPTDARMTHCFLAYMLKKINVEDVDIVTTAASGATASSRSYPNIESATEMRKRTNIL